MITSNRSLTRRLHIPGILTSVAIFLYAMPSAHADVLLAWELAGQESIIPSFGATTVHSDMQASSLTRAPAYNSTTGTGLDGSSYGVGNEPDGFFANRWMKFGDTPNPSDLAYAQAKDKYLQLTVQASAGNQFSLSSIDFNLAGQALSANTFQWAYSFNGTTFTLFGDPVSTVLDNTAYAKSVTTSGVIALQNISSDTVLTLRMYGYGANPGSTAQEARRVGFADIAGGNDVVLNGTVIPEPGSMALLTAGLLILLVSRRRRAGATA